MTARADEGGPIAVLSSAREQGHHLGPYRGGPHAAADEPHPRRPAPPLFRPAALLAFRGGRRVSVRSRARPSPAPATVWGGDRHHPARACGGGGPSFWG